MSTQKLVRARVLLSLAAWVITDCALAKPPALPVPCAASACAPAGASQFVTGGAATAVSGGNTLTVNQTTSNAILNWSSFNIGAGGTVTFKQPSSSAIALNRIFQGSPSQISGALNANGQVYFVNLNGFLFGSTATVNVGGLLVASLPLTLTDANFANGILSPLQNTTGSNAVFDATLDPLAPGVGRASVLDTNGNPVVGSDGKPLPVQIVVEPGATLTAADQGRLLLAGQTVTNGGTLTAPDGQVILAAGTKVFLQADSDPGLRGLIVEVDATAANVAENQATGSISTPRGNTTLVGMAVNQNGRISATTSVAANGSIRLEAASGAAVGGGSGNQTVASTQGGMLTIGPQSSMEILPETASSATAVPAQTQLQSTVTLLGEQVILEGGSIVAPGGTLTAIAAANPANAAAPASASNPSVINNVPSGIDATGKPTDANARLRIDAGTTIDLSGSTVSLPVTANLVSAQLRSSELADDPTQRNGALHGLTVYVNQLDMNELDQPSDIVNLSGDFAAVPQTIAQRTETGGHAVLQSQGDLVFAPGATINVSGGSSTYAGGVLQSSYLVGANGQLYPIATANPLLTYTGVVNPTFTQTFNKWGVQNVLPTPGLSAYQPGYVEGANSGSVQFVAPTMVLQGALQGGAVSGLYQRTPATAVNGATLTIGIPSTSQASGTDAPLDYVSPAVRLSTSSTPIVVADDAQLPGPLTLDLPVNYLTSSGFTSTAIYSNYGVTLPAATPLVLPAGSNLTVNAARIDLLSNITDPGGSLSFQNVYNVGAADTLAAEVLAAQGAGPAVPRSGVFVGTGVTLDVRGLWTNDMPQGAGPPPTSALWQNGGSISLGVSSPGAPLSPGPLLSLADDVTLRTSGGAWLNGKGVLTAGQGGSLTLSDNAVDSGLVLGNNVAIDGFGVNGAAGGSFDLVAPRVEIGSGGTNWAGGQTVDDGVAPGNVFRVDSSLFSAYGFENFNITASGLVAAGAPSADLLGVDDNTAINAIVSTLFLKPQSSLKPSAATLEGLAAITTLPSYLRSAANISLSTQSPGGMNGASNTATDGGTSAGDVAIGAGASIVTDVGGSISVSSSDSILVDGTLRAPGGSVSLHLVQPDASLGFDVGFLPTQRIELGSDSVIDVSGTFVSEPSSIGLTLGKVSGGGSVDLLADRGAVVTDVGSIISVAGTTAAVDAPQADGGYARETAATAAGSIAVHSGESISLLGSIDAAAGAGGTTGAAAAGSLDLTLSRSESWWGAPAPQVAGTFEPYPLIVELLPSVAGLAASSSNSNRAILGAAQLALAGFDSLRIEAGDSVELSGNLSLALNRQLAIDAPIVTVSGGSPVSLTAPYVEVGYSLSTNATPPANTNVATGGTGRVVFQGNEIDLVGTTVFQGTSDVRFSSAGDLLLRGEPVSSSGASGMSTTLQGQVTVAGSLELDAARIYPVTDTNFAIDSVLAPGAASSVTIGQTAANPGTPLSAGGSLAITADTISSTGTLYAPFGSISLTANSALTLGDGSLTSVSGNGSVFPYGQTLLGGTQWIYQTSAGAQTINGVPTRLVSLTAPSITLTQQATVDLSGGGDLSAYEWVPGSGGSLDRLTSDPTVNGYVSGLYAVLPSTRGLTSPQDPESTIASTITAGESVYLSGGAGLAAGVYPLLPARYGLLPGAFLVQIEPQLQSAAAGSLGALADGTPVVAGYLTYGSTGLHQTPGYVGFAVHPMTNADDPTQSYANQLAQYNQSLASTYFSAIATAANATTAASAGTAAATIVPTLPADAGSLSISVTSATTNTLDIAGQVRTAAASGGLGAPVQITANDLVIGSAGGTAASDAVSIAGSVITGWQPGSLLLGGTSSSDGSTIDVVSNTVTVGAGTNLVAGQIALVANQAIDVQNGAALQSTSGTSGTALAKLPAIQSITLNPTPNPAATVSATPSSTATPPAAPTPALLAVSDLDWLIPSRAAGMAPSGAATLAVDAGATIASRGSLTFDALGGVSLNGTLSGPGAAWSLGSSSIAFVPGGVQADTLSINPALVTQLGTAGAVRLASTGAIDLDTPVSLGVKSGGNSSLAALTLIGTSLNNLNSAATNAVATGTGPTVAFGAQTLTLEGSGGTTTTPTPGLTPGTLALSAQELDLGPNALAVNGFTTTQATVSGPIIGIGTGALNVGGDLLLTASGITPSATAATSISATGALRVAPTTAGGGVLPVLPGGSLSLSGNSLDIAGTVVAPAGSVTLAATGGGLSIDSGATVSAAGTPIAIQNQIVGTPGGSVAVTAASTLVLSSGATLDVSGAGAGAAGSLSLVAGGAATLGATLKGGGGTGAAGGSFSLDAASLAPSTAGANALTSLATALGSGGFNEAIDVRVRTGDLSLPSGSALVANAVNLTSDSGQVTVNGNITANSGALRGSLTLFGGTGVVVTGALRADGGTSGRGGLIEIGAGELVTDQNGLADDAYNGGSIQLTGSTISTAGSVSNGTVLLRAPALNSGDDVAIGSLASTSLNGVGHLIISPVLAFNTANTAVFSSSSVPTSADFANVYANVQTYMATASPAIAGLAPSGAALTIEPGVEIIAPGAVTLPGLDLSTWRFGSSPTAPNGAPIDLTVRAAGDLTVAGTISDGFATVTVGNTPQPVLLAGQAASIHLVAGADLASANPLAVVTGGVGDLTVGDPTSATPAVVRTTTGNIDAVAAGNVVIGNAGSGIYTAGVPAIAPGGTAADPYPGFPAKAGTEQFATDAAGNILYGYGVLAAVRTADLLMSFPDGGGNVTVRAGGDVVGAVLTTSAVPTWQLRDGGSNAKLDLPAWGVNLNAYNWNFGTLGGGDLVIAAGHDASNVTAAAAGSLLPQYGGGTQYVTGGGLSLSAGHDIGSAQVFLADGNGTVAAGGALTAVLTPTTSSDTSNVGSAFYLQSGALNVTARQGIAADAVFNPTSLLQPNTNGGVNALQGSYFTYTGSSALSLESIAGDIALGEASSGEATLLGAGENSLSGTALGTAVFPGTFSASALGGSIAFGPGIGEGGQITLYPTPRGQLDLLAAKDVTGVLGTTAIVVSDAVTGTYSTVATPSNVAPTGANNAFLGDIHIDDPSPALVTAGRNIADLVLSIPKAAQVVAGQDITDLTYTGQNFSPTDQTVLMAGRDFIYNNSSDSASVGGPGQFDLLAGRNVSLGLSLTGVITTGNLLNSNLPTAQGANLTIATGLESNPDFAGFLSKIIVPSTTYQMALINYVESLQASAGLSFATAKADFSALSPDEQRPFIDQVFFDELSISGIASNTVAGAGFAEGYAAIDALFPGSRTGTADAVPGAYAGDLTLAFSRIYTLSGGNIDLLVPGGLINVGLANPPSSLAARAPSSLGIVAQGEGNVDIYSQGDVDVNASRIFTLGGGNILIWSDEGSIDAGRGAKTAVSAPPPSVLINSDGTVSINFSGAAAGSGIRTIQTNPDQALGSVDLVAPVGTVNAGDAGIGAAGNINIAARTVVGLDNINFGGTSTGVPSQVSNIGASLSGASNAAASTSNTSTDSATARAAADAAASAPLAQTALSWLDVFVTGLGEENCKPDDIDCLKRQKTAIH